jgi:predicted DsbA family dithiol-disulfide isomerase
VTAGWLERRFGAAIVWLPFDLHPEYPPEGIPRAELHARYGEEMHERLKRSFEANGLVYAPPPERVPRSLKALQVTELARDLGRHDAVHDRLMDAYWTEGADLGNHGVLRRLARELELPDEDVERVLAGDEYAARVEASTEQAAALGISGIPAYLLADRMLILGAQPRDVFERALGTMFGAVDAG